jgi:hypothetical protein
MTFWLLIFAAASFTATGLIAVGWVMGPLGHIESRGRKIAYG